MAKLELSSGFTLIPEGSHIFKIVGCEYKEKFGKIEVKMETKNGQKHIERFNVKSEGGLNAFSYFAKTALDDFERSSIDHEELVGHFIGCEVGHTTVPHRDEPDKTVTFVNLKDKFVAYDFDGRSESAENSPASAETESKPASTRKYDLSFLDD